jgi:hypothetical protein
MWDGAIRGSFASVIIGIGIGIGIGTGIGTGIGISRSKTEDSSENARWRHMTLIRAIMEVRTG